jgi:uncharacterized protein (UPF0147 family)
VDEIISAILTEPSLAAAAARVRLSVAGLIQVATVPRVAEALRACREAAQKSHAVRLARAAAFALDRLEELANDPDFPPASRVAAASRVLAHLENLQRDDVAERVAALEASVRASLAQQSHP